MHRRRLLAAVSALLPLAGCSSDQSDASGQGNPTDAGDGAATDPPATTATSSPTPSPTPSSSPSPTPTPTASPTPTPTPTPTATPTPTLTPTPTPTPTATPTPAPAPDETSYDFDGEGGDVTGTFSTTGGLVVFDLEHSGSSNFIVEAVPTSGGQKHLLTNMVGDYDGKVAMYLPEQSWKLDIDADGDWSAEIKQPRYSIAEVKPLPASADGTHHGYIGPFEFVDTTEISIDVSNDEHLAVWLAGVNGKHVELLANEVGPYETTTLTTQEGYGLIIVESDSGAWELEVSSAD